MKFDKVLSAAKDLTRGVFVSVLLVQNLSFAQTGTITGIVIDASTSKPLAGANIAIVGTTLGAATNASGEFTINNVTEGERDVRASFIGYSSQNKPAVVREGETTDVSFSLDVSEILGQPIVVSATRGRERETPATFATLERQEIRERYTTQDIPVLLSELPSTTSYSEAGNNIGYTYLNIRGFDARRIAVMVNGIPQNDPEDHNVYWLDFPDIAASVEDIQVQRGAGSAFYGPPAIGGSVNLVTNNFGSERTFKFSGGVGSFNTRRYSASFNSGLIDKQYAFHGRLSKILSDGYRDKSWVDFNSYFLGLIRYDEKMTTQVNFYGGPVADHLAYYGIPKSDVKVREKRRANPILRDEEIENFSQPHYELFHEWRLNDKLSLNNTLFLVTGDGYFDYDGSWAPYSYYRVTPANGFNFVGDPDTLYFPNALIHAVVSNKQYGWLPRLTMKQDNGELILGAELRIHRSEHWGSLKRADVVPVPIPETYRYYEYKGAKDIFSLYAQEMYRFRPDLTAMLSVQYAYNRYRLYDEKFLGTDFAVPYHFINPRIGVNYNLDENWNSYISLAYTSREPRLKNLYDAAEASTPASWGINTRPQFTERANGAYDFNTPLVKPERLSNLEIGGGYSDEATRLNANVYWMEFSDEIVKSGQVDRFGQPITGNADKTRHIGIELSGRTQLTPEFEISGNATVSQNKFVRHTDFSSGAPLSLKNNPIAGFPDVLGNFRVTYRHENFSVSLNGRYVGKQYTNNFKNKANTVDAYFVSDASAMYKFDNIVDNVGVELKLHVNNIFDNLYATYGEGDQFFVGAARNVFFNLAINL
jgi:iron complex outermembrane receptor protein